MSALPTDFLARHKLTTEDFHRMAEAGIFHEDDRIELIEGDLIDMAPIGSRHAECVSRLTRILIRQTDHVVRVQDPITLSRTSEPQPDIAVAKPRSYLSGHPKPADLLLLIEVSDTTVEDDRKIKIPLYARYGICEVWLIDLTTTTVERYSDPRESGYRFCERLTRTEQLSPTQLPHVQIALTEVL